MKEQLNGRIRKGILGALAGYILLAVVRFTYIEIVPQPIESMQNIGLKGDTTNSAEYGIVTGAAPNNARQNYASEKRILNGSGSAKPVTIDQKYERIGFVSSKTDSFEKDKEQVNSLIAENKGIIQVENNHGVLGQRVLELSIGVLPEKFDSFVEKTKVIGEIYDFRVEKRDKTSEYKDLTSKQATLEKMRESLKALKEKGGNINDLINLENKILEVEEKIQNLGVSLGNFNEENELCTVKLSLVERKYVKVENAFSAVIILKNIVAALIWTLGYYCGLLGMLILAGILTYILIAVANKFKEFIRIFYGKKEIEADDNTNQNV